jgi:hypothetical protein
VISAAVFQGQDDFRTIGPAIVSKAASIAGLILPVIVELISGEALNVSAGDR